MKTIKAIKIDGFKQVVEMISIEDGPNGIDAALETKDNFHANEIHLEPGYHGVQNELYVGCGKPQQFGFYLQGLWVYGHALIIGYHKPTENDTDTSLTVEQVERMVHFI